MVRITKTGVSLPDSAEGINRYRLQFREKHCVKFPKLFDSELLQLIQRKIGESDFYERVHDDIGSNKELCLRDQSTSVLLHFVLNNQELYSFIQRITESEPIKSFEGRVYRIAPGSGCHDAWHNDLGDSRLSALSINVSTEVYSGGVLQIRRAKSTEIINQIPNTGFGDAILFRISPELQHRITEVEGVVPKTAFAGWFLSQPNNSLL